MVVDSGATADDGATEGVTLVNAGTVIQRSPRP